MDYSDSEAVTEQVMRRQYDSYTELPSKNWLLYAYLLD
jgi:hypothetical protein